VTCDEAGEAILSAAQQRTAAGVGAFSVHALIEATDPEFVDQASRLAIITPDGQPVRWALNWLHGVGLKRNVRGSELMWRLCERAAEIGVSIYLYGGAPETLEALVSRLRKVFPELEIAGAEAPPFRPLSPDEDEAMVERVNASGAGLMFVGLGSPKQDRFVVEHLDRIQAVQLAVGAAFDFHAGVKATAPKWMQRHGLEWVFRLVQEPRRLWKRYLVTNTQFVLKLSAAFISQRLVRRDKASAIELEPHASVRPLRSTSRAKPH
jgi:N-acetylglucosaminyldiphosphoundecaprenol N-acetyl-beta-D-mannosaminyltransferase